MNEDDDVKEKEEVKEENEEVKKEEDGKTLESLIPLMSAALFTLLEHEVRSYRKYTDPVREYLHQITPWMIATGSTAEMPTRFLPSDSDVMLAIGQIVTGSEHVQGSQILINDSVEVPHIVTMKDSYDWPGFVHLFADGGRTLIRNEDILRECNKLRLGEDPNSSRVELIYENKGPALCQEFGKVSSDTVFCYHSAEWAAQASAWRYRRQPHQWPNKEVIDKILAHGYHVVPVGHPNACERDQSVLFRFSFSLAESFLMNSVTEVQLVSYLIAKSIFKFSFWRCKLFSGDCPISSYHLKMLFFWQCENMPDDYWSGDRVVYTALGLLNDLKEAIRRRQCPSFFVPENNLFNYVNDTERFLVILESHTSLPLLSGWLGSLPAFLFSTVSMYTVAPSASRDTLEFWTQLYHACLSRVEEYKEKITTYCYKFDSYMRLTEGLYRICELIGRFDEMQGGWCGRLMRRVDEVRKKRSHDSRDAEREDSFRDAMAEMMERVLRSAAHRHEQGVMVEEVLSLADGVMCEVGGAGAEAVADIFTAAKLLFHGYHSYKEHLAIKQRYISDGFPWGNSKEIWIDSKLSLKEARIEMSVAAAAYPPFAQEALCIIAMSYFGEDKYRHAYVYARFSLEACAKEATYPAVCLSHSFTNQNLPALNSLLVGSLYYDKNTLLPRPEISKQAFWIWKMCFLYFDALESIPPLHERMIEWYRDPQPS